jgi:uncharacterized membrane protein YczE
MPNPNRDPSLKPKIAVGAYLFIAFCAAVAIVVFGVSAMQKSKTGVAPHSVTK